MPQEISLSMGLVTVVGDDDFQLVSKHKWHAVKHGRTHYAVSNIKINGKYTTVQMHRLILGVTDNEISVDHIDGNGLNNRRKNLRECSNANNAMNRRKYKNNTSGYKGVTLEKSTMKWRARIKTGGAMKSLGLFDSPELAHAAYCAAAVKMHGEFANFGGS